MNLFLSINPFTEKQFASFETISDKRLDEVLEITYQAQKSWKNIPVSGRAKLFLNLAVLLKKNVSKLAEIATLEMGKTLVEAKAEVMKCAACCEFYAANAERFLEAEITKTADGKGVHLIYEPLGIVLGIFPWNFPYWQIARSVVPVVIGGNAMLIKPAPNVPQCSMALQNIFVEAGFPVGVVQTIFATEGQVEKIIADDRIHACTLTGSEKAGSLVASNAAKQIKKSVLELGGSDPFIVLDDADLDLAISNAITSRFQNNGQSCIGAKRFILHEKIAGEFLEKLITGTANLKMGDPMESYTNIGPLARKDLLEKLRTQVDDSVKQGAKILFQQKENTSKGFFYPPTILTDIPKSSPAYREELFGPVISIFVFSEIADAIRVANDTSFGLGAAIWTKNLESGKAIASQLQCGTVFINGMVKSDPAFGFGGVKRSGYGRELGSQGLREFCNLKVLRF
ncbi:MAG: NAD-dependent succinate-semialdehyde dehydrogenase [Bacteroidia bacterium]